MSTTEWFGALSCPSSVTGGIGVAGGVNGSPGSVVWRFGANGDDEADAHTRRITANGTVMTWDIPLQENGVPAPEVIRQLTAIGQSLG